MFRRQQRSLDRLILPLEIVTYVLHLDPLHAILATDILD